MLVAVGFLAAFLWAVRTGQYDDSYTPSVRILFDNDESRDNKDIKEKTFNNIKNNGKDPVLQDEILHSVQDNN
jgi:cbb3-type cytochrome oxidase maturation protein